MKKRAFTLIELLVVIAILAILAGGAVAVYDGVEKKAAKGQARSDMAQIEKVIKNFKSSSGLYPENFDSLLVFNGATLSQNPDESYAEGSIGRRILFPSGIRNADDAVNPREGFLEIPNSSSNFAIANFPLVSWLSDEIQDKLQVLSINQEMLNQIVLSGIRTIRYVDGKADHTESTAQTITVVDSVGNDYTIGKSEDILNASQAFENPTASESTTEFENLGRGFTFFLSRDYANRNDAILLPSGIPFAIFKPGIAGANNINVGAGPTDVLIALGVGNNCSIVNTEQGSKDVNVIKTSIGLSVVPQYGGAGKEVYGRYIALFKVARFLTNTGRPDTGKIDADGEFNLNNASSFGGEEEYSATTPARAGLEVNSTGIQFVGVIDCYGYSIEDIFSQYQESNN